MATIGVGTDGLRGRKSQSLFEPWRDGSPVREGLGASSGPSSDVMSGPHQGQLDSALRSRLPNRPGPLKDSEKIKGVRAKMAAD